MAPPTKRAAELVAILGAFSFLLSAIEYAFPKPLPFMRLGIANLPLLLAVDLLPFPSFLVLAMVKIIGMSLVSGTLFSYIALFSAAGSLASALAMWATRRAGGAAVSHIGVSVVGAMASSSAQILLARALVFGPTAYYVAPLFFATSLVTGLALGFFASRFAESSRWYAWRLAGAGAGGLQVPLRVEASVRADPSPLSTTGPASKASLARRRRAEGWEARFDPGALATAGALVALSLFFQPHIALKALLVALLAIATLLSGRRISVVAALLVSVGIIGANLAIPVGRVLGRLGPLVITETALLEGLSKALVFQGLVYASKASIRVGLRFPGRLGTLVSEAFVTYEGLIDGGLPLRPGRFIEDADALLLRVEGDMADKKTTPPERATQTKTSATPILIVAVALSLLLLALGVGLALPRRL